MFHRQNPRSDNEPNQQQGSLLREPARTPQATREQTGREVAQDKPAVEIYAKTEKETQMQPNQNQPNAHADHDAETPAPASQARPMDIPNPSGLQRPMQTPRMPGTFPGSYNTAPSPVYGQGPQASKAHEGRRLVVGEGISLSGEIESCDVLIVEGTIEAALKGAKVLEIAETGVYYGTVEIEEATVAGRFEGDLTVNGRLTIRASGSITGTVSYKELAIEAGAVLDGKVTPLSGSRAEKKSEGSRPGMKKAPVRNDNSGNELPFADKAASA